MPKIARTFKEEPEVWAILDKYAEELNIDKTEALGKTIRAILSPQNSSEGEPSPSGASDLLPCKQRLGIQPNFSCLNPPTLYRKVKITEITAEVCRACQVLSKNLPEKYEIKEGGHLLNGIHETPTQETFDRPREPIRDPNKDMSKHGMTYCPDGLWVFLSKCDSCRTKHFAAWDSCHRQKYRERGEQLRQSTASKP